MSPLVLAVFGVGPLPALVLSVALIVLAIGVLRLHAFFALMLAAIFVAIVARVGPAAHGDFSAVVEIVMAEFGAATGRIGFSIVIAAVIGTALMESGAAEKIIQRLIASVGPARAPLALMIGSFVLSIPIFFDTVFFLLVPLVRTLSLRTGRNYVLNLLAVCAGGVVGHATVPPTPGPLAAAEILHVELGRAIVWGFGLGIVPALGALWFARWVDRRLAIPVRPLGHSHPAAPSAPADERQLPGFAAAITPIVLPVVLIALASFAGPFRPSLPAALASAIAFFGNKNIALLLGALWAVAVYLRAQRRRWRDVSALLGDPIATAGVIILITAAGGAYGAMLKQSGIAEVVTGFSADGTTDRLLLAWLLAAVLRIAQGSTTVAMITAAGIVASLGVSPGIDPVYVLLASGYGALSLSWMNDSGFWIFSRMSGLTESETLRSWTPLIAVVSVLGLAELLLLSRIWPILAFPS